MLQVLFISFILLFISWGPAIAQENEPIARIHGIMINADSMFRDNERQTLELEGNIQIVYQNEHIRAQKARISQKARHVELFGNVEIMNQETTIFGQKVYLDYENNTGMIYDGYVQSGPVIFAGSTLQKTGESTYIVDGAEYTTCTNCPATWSFSGSKIRADIGGYAYIKSALIRVGNLPVFWLPYLIVPLKSERQSGLLVPGLEVSDRGGVAPSIPYFWAIDRSSDATIEAKHYFKRGLKGLVEYRYMLNETSSGTLRTALLNDKAFTEDSRYNQYLPDARKEEPLTRWFLGYDHYYEMPNGIIQRAQLNLASDLQYPKDFPMETLNHGDSAMENRVSVTKNTTDTHFSLDSSYYVNMLHGNPLNGNEDAVHRLPEMRFSQLPVNLGNTNFVYSYNLSYVNFTRSGQAYDDMFQAPGGPRFPKNTCSIPNWEDDPDCSRSYDGSFDPNVDLIRTGQRLDFQPTIYYPIKVADGLDLVPRVTLRETHYGFNIPEYENLERRYIRSELTARTSFSRIYGDTFNSKATRYKHEVIPEVTYTRIPWLQQSDHPFFGRTANQDSPYASRDYITDLDIASEYGVQFDYDDRVYDSNLVTISVINKLTQKIWQGERPTYRQIGYLKVSQSFDESQSGTGANQPWSDISTILDVRLNYFQTYSTLNYFPYQGVTNVSSRVRLLDRAGRFIQGQLTQQFKITPGQDVDRSQRQEDYTFSAGVTSKFVNLMGKVVYDANWENSANKNKLKSWAYIAQLKPPGDCTLITFIYDQITGGDSNIKFSIAFNFDGQAQQPLPIESLDSYGF